MKKIIKTCPICSKEFSVPFCHQHRYKTCGHKCGGIYRKKPIISNVCINCNEKFISKKHPTKSQKFCSKKCARLTNIKNAIQKNFKKTVQVSKKIYKICMECNKEFSITQATIDQGTNRGQFCNASCRIKNWNKKSLERQMPGSYRNNAWKVYEKKCYDCGIKDKRILVIHHIDGNRKNGKIKNLIPVCHNCHCIRHIELSGNHKIPSYRGHD